MSDNAFTTRYGPWAVIAGGSDGIGAAFADQLAARGIHVFLLARRESTLQECAATLREKHRVEVDTLSVDLTAPDLLERVTRATEGLEVGLLVYNAGAGTHMDRFLDQPVERAHAMIALNCSGPVALAHHFGGAMRERGRGGMIFLTSMAGLAGCSYQVAYSATKAFDQVFAEALWHDLHPAGIDVLSLVVGATRTPTHARMGLDFAALNPDDPRAAAMEPEEVAREGLAHLGRKPLWAAGERNRALLPLFFSSDRARVVNLLSQGAASIQGLEHVPVSPPEEEPEEAG